GNRDAYGGAQRVQQAVRHRIHKPPVHHGAAVDERGFKDTGDGHGRPQGEPYRDVVDDDGAGVCPAHAFGPRGAGEDDPPPGGQVGCDHGEGDVQVAEVAAARPRPQVGGDAVPAGKSETRFWAGPAADEAKEIAQTPADDEARVDLFVVKVLDGQGQELLAHLVRGPPAGIQAPDDGADAGAGDG